MKRHRYATLAELVEILAVASHRGYCAGKIAAGNTTRLSETGEQVIVPFQDLSESAKDISRAAAAAMLDELHVRGVPVLGLVKILADESDTPPSVNLTERPEDTVRRFAGDLQYAEQLLTHGRSIIQALIGGTADPTFIQSKAEEWLKTASEFPHRTEDAQ